MTPLLLMAALAAVEAPIENGDRLLTLAEAQRTALAMNPDAQVGRERLTRAGLLTRRALAALLPLVSANGSYLRTNATVTIPLGGSPALLPLFTALGLTPPPPNNITIQKVNELTSAVSFSWLVASGPAFVEIGNAYRAVESASLTYAELEDAIYFGTAALYYAALNDDDQVSIRRRSLERARDHARIARARLDAGAVVPTVALRAEVEVASAEQQLIQAENAARLAHRALATIMGVVAPDGSFEDFTLTRPEETTPLPEPLTLAFAERLDLRQARLQLDVAERNRLATWLEFLPAFAATGVFTAANVQSFTAEFTNWQVGVGLQWTLFDGGLRFWELQERRHDIEIARLTIEKTRVDIAEQVAEARLNIDSARAELQVAARRVALATKNAEAVRAQFEVGVATEIELLDANRELQDAETARALARLGVDLGSVDLARATSSPSEPTASPMPQVESIPPIPAPAPQPTAPILR